jgi:hypothetical protein
MADLSPRLACVVLGLAGPWACGDTDVLLGGRPIVPFTADGGAPAPDATAPLGGVPGSGGSSGALGGKDGGASPPACPTEAAPHAGAFFQGPYIAIGDVALDRSHVYLKVSDCCDRPPGYVLRLPLAGGAAETVHASARYHTGLALDDAYVHFTSEEGLKTFTKATSTITIVPDAVYDALALFGDRVYAAAAGKIASHGRDGIRVHAQGAFTPEALAVDERGIYFTNRGAAATVMFVPAAGGPASPLVPGAGAGGDLATDADHLYFSLSGAAAGPVGLVRARKSDGAGLETLAAIRDLAGLAMDATHVYFTRSGTPCARSPAGTGQMGGALLRVPKAGGPMVELARDLVAPGKVAVDATHVYFVAGSNRDHYRALHRRAK